MPKIANHKIMEDIKINVGDADIVGTIFKPKKDLHPKSIVIIDTGLSLNRWNITTKFAEYISAKGFTAFAYDRRAHNESTGEFSAKKLPEDLDKIISHLTKRYKKNNVALFGFCYGGIPATYCAATNNKVKAITLVNSYPDYDYMERRSRQFNTRYFRYSLAWLVEKIRIKRLVPDSQRELHVVKLEKGTGLHYSPRKFIPELINGLDTRTVLPKIKIPTLFIQSKKDRMINTNIVKEMFNLCGSKDKNIIEVDDGHFLKRTLPDVCKEAVTFFKKHI